MLRAPLSGRECVYFETRAVLIFAGERVLARKTSAADFYVDDGTGQVLIPRDQIRGLDAPEDVVEYRSPEEVFGLLGATAPDRNLNNMIVYERIIPSLTPISVQGVAVRSDAANRGLQLENCEIIARCEAVSVELQ